MQSKNDVSLFFGAHIALMAILVSVHICIGIDVCMHAYNIGMLRLCVQSG